MNAVTVTDENFREEVLECEKTVLADFWSPRCAPCRALAPIIDEIAEECKDVKVVKINVDEQKQTARDHQIMSIPTLIVFRNGEAVGRNVGALPKAEILAMLHAHTEK